MSLFKWLKDRKYKARMLEELDTQIIQLQLEHEHMRTGLEEKRTKLNIAYTKRVQADEEYQEALKEPNLVALREATGKVHGAMTAIANLTVIIHNQQDRLDEHRQRFLALRVRKYKVQNNDLEF